jgi:hypothetical protein
VDRSNTLPNDARAELSELRRTAAQQLAELRRQLADERQRTVIAEKRAAALEEVAARAYRSFARPRTPEADT